MTEPARPVYTVGTLSVSRLFMFAAAVLFVLAAFAAGGDALGGVNAWSYGFGAFAAVALAWALP